MCSPQALGIIFHQYFWFETQVKKVAQSCLYRLRNTAQVKSFISVTDVEKPI